MKGEVLHYDDNSGIGYIAGDDGVRYAFARADLKQLTPLSNGARVDFDIDGRNAREIFLIQSHDSLRAPVSSGYGRSSVAEPDLGLWGYFTRALTSYYANFSGRARRKEYWGFYLIYVAILLGVGISLALLVGAMSANARSTGGTYQPGALGIVVVLLGIALLATIIPTIALTVRRFHDIGQSGWLVLLFYVLGVVPVVNFVSSIVWLVMLCLDSQPGDNKYGAPAK